MLVAAPLRMTNINLNVIALKIVVNQTKKLFIAYKIPEIAT